MSKHLTQQQTVESCIPI